MFGKIHVKFFVVAFAVGLLACYLFTPPPQVVVKFPSPNNAGQVVYRDKNDTCFKFQADKVSCPRDKSLIRSQPIMEDFRSSGSTRRIRKRGS